MRILVDVTHPAHVHLFRHAIEAFQDRGHVVSVASREKDVTTALLDAYDLPHTPLSRKQSGAVGVAHEWFGRELRLLRLAKQFAPDVILSRLNPAAAHVSTLLGVPNVVFHDTEVAGLLDRVTTPFAAVVCTPAAFDRDLWAPQPRYTGFHELAYLHPARFERDPDALRAAGVEPEESYAVLRLVEMTAHHDAGATGFSPELARSFIDELGEETTVYVTSEGSLPADLQAHESPVPPETMHQLLAFADLCLGDSSTMATEAGVLGTPSVRYNPLGEEMGNFEALAEYGLVESTPDPEDALERAVTLARDPDAARRWRRRRRHMLAENVDLTAFMVELVEEVMES